MSDSFDKHSIIELSDAQSNKSSQEVNLTSIHVTGADQFSDKFLQKGLAPLLRTSDSTIGDLITDAQKSASFFSGTDCFQNVDILIDKDLDYKQPTHSMLSTEVPMNLKAFVNLVPYRLKSVQFGSVHDSIYGHLLSLTYTNRNTSGIANYTHLAATVNKLDAEKGQTITGTFKIPMANPINKIVANFSARNGTVSRFQSKNQVIGSAQFGFERHPLSNPSGIDCSFFGGLNFAKRSILNVADSASDEVKTYAGDSIKQSLILNLNFGRLDCIPASEGAFPLEGFRSNLRAEYTNLPFMSAQGSNNDKGDHFEKLEFNGAVFKSFLQDNITFGCGIGCGNIRNLRPSVSDTVHFMDKFYVSMPGYGTLGLNHSFIGGRSYLSYNFVLYTRLLFASKKSPLRTYFSLSGAKLCQNLDDLINPETNINYLKSTASTGITYKVGDYAHCNIGYHWPLDVTDVGDIHPGIELNVSLYGDF